MNTDRELKPIHQIWNHDPGLPLFLVAQEKVCNADKCLQKECYYMIAKEIDLANVTEMRHSTLGNRMRVKGMARGLK